MNTVPMTKEGLDKLNAEVAELEERRPKVLQQIKEAREKGDLSENAEYHAAREDLSMLEGRIRELKDKVSRAVIVDKTKIGGDTVVFGATVKLLSLSDNEEEEYTLVGEGENDPLNGRILTTSPMGQALLTKKVGDKVEVPTPKGALKFKVLEIRYV
ncbi:MAG TPA: transcription elongation factor GreA [Planctomycetota bacterium]|nr:transcription elongation factor GreA [Planctomycetota bacterium]